MELNFYYDHIVFPVHSLFKIVFFLCITDALTKQCKMSINVIINTCHFKSQTPERYVFILLLAGKRKKNHFILQLVFLNSTSLDPGHETLERMIRFYCLTSLNLACSSIRIVLLTLMVEECFKNLIYCLQTVTRSTRHIPEHISRKMRLSCSS